MRIVITEFISLDGVVQAPGGPHEDTDGGFAHGGWSQPFFDPDVGPWHVRDASSLAERLGAPLYVPPPDEGDPNPVEGHVFTAGERLPVGVEAFPGMEPNDLVLWVESRLALVVGDTLIDRGHGLEFPTDWADTSVPPEQILEKLQPLLELPVELVLPTHGAPTDRAALEHALS